VNKRRPTARALNNTLGAPADGWIDLAEEDEAHQLRTSPGFQRILDAVNAHPHLPVARLLVDMADQYGFDPTDPAIIERAITSAERAAEQERRTQEYRHQGRRLHEPVVYYMRVGNRVKIGTTTNIVGRIEAISPEQLLTMEWGGHGLERQRHGQFTPLRTAREWFRLEAPLDAHIAALAAQFEQTFGSTIEKWMNGHPAVSAAG
jgi:hypothetical protein